jgi:UDP-glucuronate decarboxylase
MEEKESTVIDVRDLVDKPGNPVLRIQEKINQGVIALNNGRSVIVCCDYGMSRSNAIAAGILISFEKGNFDHCLRRVLEATGETDVKLGPLMAVRNALGLSKRQRGINRRPRVLVTGGSGFLGQALQANVSSDFELCTPSRSELDLTQGNTKLALLAEEHGADWIAHLANPRIYTSNIAMGQTLTMLSNVIDVCVNMDIPLLYPSGWEIYSGYAGTLRANEAIPPLPRGPYGETKFLAEALIEHHVRTSELRCALIRSSPVYGKGSDRPKFIYNFIGKAVRHLTITTHQYANGDPMLDLLYVDDLVAAIIAAIKSEYIGPLNIGSGVLTSTRHIARILTNKLNSSSRIEQIPINTDTACIAMDWSRARREIGWEPRISLEKGLDDILQIFLKRSDQNDK